MNRILDLSAPASGTRARLSNAARAVRAALTIASRALWTEAVRRYETWQAIRYLQRADARMLRDIGITRDQIEERVRGGPWRRW